VHDLFLLASKSSIGWRDGLKHNQLKHSHVQPVHPLTILAEFSLADCQSTNQ
jgi:hypothetical protein